MDMPSVETIIAALQSSKYFILFAGSYIEGTAVMLTGGILYRLGQVDFWPMYWSLFMGDFLSDLMWYFIGYVGARRFVLRWGHLVNATPAIIEKVERRFHKYHMQILVISKLTMGFGLAVPILMTAGMMRVSLLRYIMINVVAGFFWIMCVVLVGYYFGNVLAYVPSKLQIALVPLAFIFFILLLKAVSKRLEKVNW